MAGEAVVLGELGPARYGVLALRRLGAAGAVGEQGEGSFRGRRLADRPCLRREVTARVFSPVRRHVGQGRGELEVEARMPGGDQGGIDVTSRGPHVAVDAEAGPRRQRLGGAHTEQVLLLSGTQAVPAVLRMGAQPALRGTVARLAADTLLAD